MGRRPREDAKGSWHHVMNRGVGKRPLFENRADVRFFLARLVRQIRAGRIELHAYCLMTNHFHLLVRSPIGELSEAMRRAQNEHSRRFNRRHERDGALVRGRYTSKIVRSLAYRRTLVGYIDANPVKAGMVGSCFDYEFGSARAYATTSEPRWLTRDWIASETLAADKDGRFSTSGYLAAFGSGGSEESLELVRARIASTSTADPLDELIGAAPQQVQGWLRNRSLVVDGERVGLPICGPKSLEWAFAFNSKREGLWRVEDEAFVRQGKDVAKPALLRDLCGLSWQTVARHTSKTPSQAIRRVTIHRRLFAKDRAYAGRTARVSKEAIDRCASSHGMGRGRAVRN